MKVPRCVGCDRPVLGLAGQMAKLDSYYLEEAGPAAESAGYWHARCLADTAHAAAWYLARLRNFVVVRAYEVVAELDSWTVVRHPRRANVVALARTGLLLDLSDLRGPGRRLPAGRAFSVRIDDYNLELDDTATIDAMQRALRDEGVFKLPALLDALQIGDCILHPEILADGMFHITALLRAGECARCVGAGARGADCALTASTMAP